eukprot:COSAG03_NODE_10187_length_666_cov_1.142857_2_plen_73_part_01
MRERESETERRRSSETDRQAGRQAGRQTDRKTDRQTDKRTPGSLSKMRYAETMLPGVEFEVDGEKPAPVMQTP